MVRALQQRAEQKIIGFQSPAGDYLEGRLNIADVLVIDPHSTYYFRMDSPSMQKHGLQPGDILIIDRSVLPVDGSIVIAYVEDNFYCRCYQMRAGNPVLAGDDDVIKTTNGEILQIWGVVIATCRNMLPPALRKGKYRHVCTL